MTLDEAEKIKSVVENKKYIEQLVETVSKVLVEAFENIKIEDVNMFKIGYNKAIDDFVNEVKERFPTDKNGIMHIEEMAEQLKDGGESDRAGSD